MSKRYFKPESRKKRANVWNGRALREIKYWFDKWNQADQKVESLRIEYQRLYEKYKRLEQQKCKECGDNG